MREQLEREEATGGTLEAASKSKEEGFRLIKEFFFFAYFFQKWGLKF